MKTIGNAAGVDDEGADKYNKKSRTASQLPQLSFYGSGKFLRMLCVYAVYQYLETTSASLIQFVFWCLLGSALAFLVIQQPWKGRPLPSSQWAPTVINGFVLAMSLLLWGHALRTSGVIRTIVAEYAGVAVGGISMLFLSKRGNRARKIQGLLSLAAAFFMFSRGWSSATSSPFLKLRQLVNSDMQPATSDSADAGQVSMLVPVAAGLMAAARRLLARRVALKTQSKKRMQAITVISAALFMAPMAFFEYLSLGNSEGQPYAGSVIGVHLAFIVFGIVLHFYVESFGEDRLNINSSSPMSVAFTLGSVAAVELFNKGDFSVLGFALCSSVLALGVHLSGSVEISRREAAAIGLVPDDKEKQRRGATALLPGPVAHLWADQKSRKIASFLLINTIFMVVEFVYGFFSNSLGLISDACHMLFDCAALAIGLYASYIARLPSTAKYPYGYGRYEVLSGYVNAIFLVFVATLIILESIERVLEPPDISTDKLMLVSVGGFLVNMIGLLFFHEAHMHSHGHDCGGGHSHSHGGHSHGHDHSHQHDHEHGHAHEGHAHSHEHGETCSGGHSHHDHDHGHKHDHEHGAHLHHDHDHDGGHAHNRSEHSHDHTHAHEHKHLHEHGHAHEHEHSNPKHEHSHHEHEHSPSPGAHQHSPSCDHGHSHDHRHSHDHAHGHTEGAAAQDGENGHVQVHGHEQQPGTPESRWSESSLAQGGGTAKGDSHGHAHGDEEFQIKSRVGRHAHGHEERSASPQEPSSHLHHHVKLEEPVHTHSHAHHGHSHEDHNMRGIFLHVLADTLGSVGVIISTALIQYCGWVLADPVCSIFISLLIVSSVIPLLQTTGELLLQRVPASLERDVQTHLGTVDDMEGVLSCRKAHFWSFTPKMTVGSLCVRVTQRVNKQDIRLRIANLFKSAGISHLTVEIEDDSATDGLYGAYSPSIRSPKTRFIWDPPTGPNTPRSG
ncbi:Cation efflux family protein [Klebsormidium nitens]|uniref:Cation efflux family protein n=1 Tax=Klebsormidium nitens TaxID=105231 RepID=A0A1Y1IQK7_KLENI|nr:Cation efflux family protein [Klebsormidium nitens]|eukprot:GAQ90907.1 Cation efflux family protein [Klebsormidium nitens]